MANLHPKQFQEALDIVKNTKKEFIEGDDLKKVYKAANIRVWPLDVGNVFGLRNIDSYGRGRLPAKDKLNTAQDWLYTDTLRYYLAGNTSNVKPPDVVTSARGSSWITDGHHRVVASRLNKKKSIGVTVKGASY